MTAMVVGEGAGIVASYVLGTFPTAQLVGRRLGHDPLREGSGNPGASNVYRTAGRTAGAFVLLGDAVKGAVPAGVALVASGRPLANWCWVAAVLGHVVAIPRVRRGGKGVATAGGGAMVLYPLVSVALIVVFAVVAKRWRMAALASLTIAVLLPPLVALSGRGPRETALAGAVSALVIVRHHANIGRLLHRTERAMPTR
jgi:glycerol-3-phosphate acyltransferase PlsY